MKPKNWPDNLAYLTSPQHDKTLSNPHLSVLRAPSSPTACASSTQTPSPLVRIQLITNPAHPAHGQRGLFAARDLSPGQLALVYLGNVHPGSASAMSDYDIWLDREADVAVDAARAGNEARFINDYRGVGEGPNAEFGNVWCERWGEVCVGVWVLGGVKRPRGIRRGEEILVSYGKGFWASRQ